VDLLPISNLLKREVREMSRFMGVPEEVITKAPSAGLWDGQTDEGEMGFTYDMLDLYLEDPNPFTAIERGVPAKVVDKIERMHACSEHKRHTPPSPKF
jgi:NAD+ synthase